MRRRPMALVVGTALWFLHVAGCALDRIDQNVAGLRCEVKQEVRALRGELHNEVGTLRRDLRSDLAALRGDLRGQVGLLRRDLRHQVRTLRTHLGERLDTLHGGVEGGLDELQSLLTRVERNLTAVGAVFAVGQTVPESWNLRVTYDLRLQPLGPAREDDRYDLWAKVFKRIVGALIEASRNVEAKEAKEAERIRVHTLKGPLRYVDDLYQHDYDDDYDVYVAGYHCLDKNDCDAELDDRDPCTYIDDDEARKQHYELLKSELMRLGRNEDDSNKIIDKYSRILYGFMLNSEGEGWLKIDFDVRGDKAELRSGTAVYADRYRPWRESTWASPVFDITVHHDPDDPVCMVGLRSQDGGVSEDNIDLLRFMWGGPVCFALEQRVEPGVDGPQALRAVGPIALRLIFRPYWGADGRLAFIGEIRTKEEDEPVANVSGTPARSIPRR